MSIDHYSAAVPHRLQAIGGNLRQARKKRFPNDDMREFALRIGVSRATLQKMEQGDLSVGLGNYYEAAKLLDLELGFQNLFAMETSLFDD